MNSGRSPSRGKHIAVMRREVLQYLELAEGLTVVDGTVGAGGHSADILSRIGPSGRLIGIDRDTAMLDIARKKLQALNVILEQDSYANLEEILQRHEIGQVDRILLDVGLSSVQLSDPDRGFGFESEGLLDMRYDSSKGQPAWQLLESIEEGELVRLLEEYGEEPFAKKIAFQIVSTRGRSPIRTPADLIATVEAALPSAVVAKSRKEPATRVFQALRIAVNQELDQLQIALDHVLYDSLKPGGIAVIISFHSLEDVRVKQEFRRQERWQILTPKPVTASPSEIRGNPRSRTAKLRGARKRP
ncbi:MAG: 16S rRNA (cytosine(1402)-N(4))-methyltransferase RsmH [Planctomycetaceae bacterium]|nr:16S rRNA (cytosine(1402)-N(4))-methyltransferase RsmH [Planctomycetaceae bacterium]